MLRLKLVFHIKFWLFYLSNIFFKLTPKIVNSPNRTLKKRIDYYNKLDNKFKITSGVRLKEVPGFNHNSAYFYDFYRILFFQTHKNLIIYWLTLWRFHLFLLLLRQGQSISLIRTQCFCH